MLTTSTEEKERILRLVFTGEGEGVVVGVVGTLPT